jgi:uncharacterized protein YggE
MKESTKLIMWFSVFKISTIPVRKLAMKDAKLKAEDYVSVLGQSRQSCNYYRQFTKLSTTAFYARMKTMEMDESAATRETLAAGEITITANASVSFY